ncbi:hypothetical protein RRU01S_44_00010 [Agrobacterium rubi TR3 = NBRC 13261]|uniref:Knr4/Smi1-like domain-containing protein n=2 Tax=Agrobacterium rubi TaxID=28099 RepID=A0A081D3I6_9HYPH|nr:hypothetical protein RRU01S_44_00010 [Agrobacterium rubi TR3 = NBRC 13261]
MTMERSFQIVAQWLQENDPDKVPPFNQPATEDEIISAERRFGLELPDAVIDLYRLANGQPSNAAGIEGSFVIMSLDEAVDAANFLNSEFPDGINADAPDDTFVEADHGVRSTWWSRHWIPVMHNGGGDYLCADLDPAEGGSKGQIISYYHDEMFRSLVAPSVDSMLDDLASRLVSGRFRINDGMIEEI